MSLRVVQRRAEIIGVSSDTLRRGRDRGIPPLRNFPTKQEKEGTPDGLTFLPTAR